MITVGQCHTWSEFFKQLAQGKSCQYRLWSPDASWQDWVEGDPALPDLASVVAGTFEWRIRPEPIRRPLNVDEIKPGWLLRNSAQTKGVHIITYVGSNGAVGIMDDIGLTRMFLDVLMRQEWQMSSDSGQTWHPCWKEETQP